jgi:hypothetical protein
MTADSRDEILDLI